MSRKRGIGRRERVAGNRHRRGVVHIFGGGSESGTYKLGRKKYRIHLSRSLRTSSSAVSDGRETAVVAHVAETEQQAPASTRAPIVGPERVSSPSHRIFFVRLKCEECDVVVEGDDFSEAHFWLTFHRLDIH